MFSRVYYSTVIKILRRELRGKVVRERYFRNIYSDMGSEWGQNKWSEAYEDRLDHEGRIRFYIGKLNRCQM